MTVAQPAASEAPPRVAEHPRTNDALQLQRRLQLLSLLVADLTSTNLAFLLAYHLRYMYELGGDVIGESFVEYPVYAPVQALFVALCLLAYQTNGSYSLPRGSSVAAEAVSIFGSTAVATMIVFTVTSLIHYPASSRLTLIYAWLFAFAFGVVNRALLRSLRARLHRAGYGAERVIVVGSNHLARMIMQVLAHQPALGYRVLGFVDGSVRQDFGRFRALGTVEQLPALIDELRASRVIVALPAVHHAEALRVVDHCRRDGVDFSLVPDLFELRLSHVAFETVGGIPLFRLHEGGIAGLNLLLKRAIDVFGSVAVLVALFPLMALVAAAIKLDSRGPVFFGQPRLGRGGAPFICYKFRSMRVGAQAEQQRLQELNEASGPIFKIRDDPRLTRVGRIIRRASLDELPQLWNVLRGEMSLVGPRPPLPAEVERYEDWHRRRLEIVPGITGLWQVSGRSVLPFDEMAMLDIYYIENWSLGLDLQILARTIPAVFAGDGAF